MPEHFDEARLEVLHALMQARPLATVVTHSTGGLDANHLPLLLMSGPTPQGTLHGHVARANPVWREAGAGSEVLAIFHGPSAYITPSWYPTKAETWRVVPTWNYVVVHAHGPLRIIDDAHWLRSHLEALTARHEAAFPPPWQATDAPPDYIERLIGAVVGIEIEITRLQGKWKLSQNQPQSNRAGVVNGLRLTGNSAAEELAAWINDD